MKFINEKLYGVSTIGQDEFDQVRDVLLRGELFRYSAGNSLCLKTEELIREVSASSNAVLTVNGTAGLKAALFALGINQNDKVAINAFTFVATANSVLSLGAIPIPVDFDYSNNLDLNSLLEALKLKLKAIVVVHWPGRCFNISKVIKIAKRFSIPVIEDACQAFGAKNEYGFAGTFGDVGIFSFQQNKQISCGEGGCIITDNRNIASKVTQFIDHGAVREESGFPNWDVEKATFGENLRMNELQAAVLLPQIRRLFNIIEIQKKRKSELLNRLIAHGIEEWNPMRINDNGMVATFRFKDERAAKFAIEFCANNGVLISHIWRKPYYEYLPYLRSGLTPEKLGVEKCEKAEALSRCVLGMPTPPKLKTDSINKMADCIVQLKELLES